MTDFICVGKVVNTHGIKGEIRILSNFEQKNKVFVPNFKIFIGEEKKEHIITTFRHHKEYEMITLKDITNINEVLFYKKELVYIKRSDLHLKDDEYLLGDLIGMNVVNENKKLGKVINIVYNNANILMEVASLKKFYIPINDNFIKIVDLKNKEVNVQNAEGLIP